MPRFSNVWEVTPETAHPRASQLLGQSIVWNFADDDSPLGNDVGWDTFAAYLDFRATYPENRTQEFLREELASREIPDADWDLLDPVRLEESLKSGTGYKVVRRDDIIIGLAFAQLLLEGALCLGLFRPRACNYRPSPPGNRRCAFIPGRRPKDRVEEAIGGIPTGS